MQRNPRPVLLWVKEVTTTRRLSTVTSSNQTKPSIGAGILKGSKEASSLYHRITALGSNSAGVIQTLDQWVNVERKTLCTYDITCFINQLRKYKQFNHALQLLEWLEKKGVWLSRSHNAKKIDLLYRTKDIMSAEKYFTGLPNPAKNEYTYAALLNCYCREKIIDKAMELVKKMRELNFDATTFAYNSLMTLYMKLGEPEKVPLLAQEMKERQIVPDLCSYHLLMSSYASLKDTEGMERVVEEMNAGGKIEPQWSVYANLASMYIASGLFEKAELALKEIERRKKSMDRLAFHFLLSMYASIGKASEVSRVWETLKSAFPRTTNLSYLTMLQTLARLNDLDGLRNCFKEWESNCLTYDIRLVNVVILAYLKRERIEEAKLLIEGAISRGSKPNSATFMMFVDFYMKNKCMDLALKFLRKAILDVEEHEWQLYQERAHQIMKQFENEIDVGSTEELQKILEQAKLLQRRL
ncbi:pentatricopeptide repeat-containing protein At1g60770-like [Telopea speciosissima]|uniref:pentatricopeptide repeat-containing protein At1g60770-like n=1 Tax=Telopea speciosissima TaxID=54955 RepID=UPI001CC6E477|nr:pentatricopeptide repeat-containing protein At1g60770-like [Telopea speciosissima]